MEEGRQKELQFLEEIIDKGLKQKLLQSIPSRDNIFEDQKALPDTRHIFMDVGLGFHVEFTRQEALDYIPQREERVQKQLEEVTGVIVQIKGRIKLAHHQIQLILNLPDENPSSCRQQHAFQY